MPNGTKTLHPALERYLLELDELGSQSRPSVFWERQLAQESDKAYGFQKLEPEVAAPEQHPAYKEMLKRAKQARVLAKQLSPSTLDMSKKEWEDMRALELLQRDGLLEEYLEFIRPLRVRSSLSVMRHWYYAREIVGLLAKTHPEQKLDVLEIGGGAGNLALFLTQMGVVRSYTIVDLPRMLTHSAYTIGQYVPGAELAFNSAPGDSGTYTFIVDFEAANLLSVGSFDLCLNLNSFMEMDREARDGYIELIYRTGRPGALFYNVNRRQPALPLRDGETWDNNPLLYPYQPGDRILRWEDDRFQAITRSKWGTMPTLAVMRASVIRPGGA